MIDSEQVHREETRNGSIDIKDEQNLDEDAKSVLARLREKNITTLEPIFQQEAGFRYLELEDMELHEQLRVLHQFEKADLVKSELFAGTLRCPNCLSTKFSAQLSCSVCQSSNVTRGAVIEHLECGNIDFDSKYGQEQTNTLVCPKCGKRLKAIGVDYARPGTFYRCLNCKALLPQTDNTYSCLKCTKTWSEAHLEEFQLMKYTLDLDKAAAQFVHTRLLPVVAEFVYSKYGIKADSPGKAKGLSRIEHVFDLLVTHYENGDPMLAADLLDKYDKPQMANVGILAFYAKCLDANHATSNVIKKILVTKSDLNKEARELAKAYNITIVQTTDPDEMISIVLKVLAPDRIQE